VLMLMSADACFIWRTWHWGSVGRRIVCQKSAAAWCP